MEAVILAAGQGTRLRPITDRVPKCMVQVGNMPILKKQITGLVKYGVSSICVVGGYKRELIRQQLKRWDMVDRVRLVENCDYESTNNMYSLDLCRDFVAGKEFLLINGDVFFDDCIIRQMLGTEAENIIACEKNRYINESMKISTKGNVITAIGKTISKADSYGTSIDVYKFGAEASKKLFQIIDMIIRDEKERNAWSEVAIDRLLKVERVVPLDIDGRWVEIDDHNDLVMAEKIFAE